MTRDLCGILLFKSSSTKRVFESRVLYITRVSKTRDASLLKRLKRVLTYYIDYPYYASSHISSLILCAPVSAVLFVGWTMRMVKP